MLLDAYKKRFDWPPQEYDNLNESTDVSRGIVLVTGSSANHFKYVIMFHQPRSSCKTSFCMKKIGRLKYSLELFCRHIFCNTLKELQANLTFAINIKDF